MKLFPPQSSCRLYEEGFDGGDLLERREAGQRLSELLEKVEDPIVVAVDGPWGSGKTHFLKRWVGAHNLENGGVATMVYFDAFANDFLDDPLIALTGAISDRLTSKTERSKWDKAKKVVVKLARPVLRIGAATATAGATELAGPILDAAIEAGGKEAEKAAEAFWRREDGRKAAMQQFQDYLAKLTVPSPDEETDVKPLIVVIDELDRCRPDYSLTILEVVKHFFSVPRVHFVLGVNMDALEHIVRARYGIGVNAADYLKRFISVSMRLPEFVAGSNNARAQVKYFQNFAKSMGIEPKLAEEVVCHLKMAVEPSEISLRDIEKLLTRLVLLPHRKELDDFNHGWKALVVSLILLQVIRPEFYRAAMNRTLTIREIDAFYGIKPEMLEKGSQRSAGYNHSAYIIRGLWQFALSGGTEPEKDRDHFSKAFDSFGMSDANRILSEIERDFFGLFKVAE